MSKQGFWNFNAKDEKTGELYLYGEISTTSWWGDEITPKQFKADLDALGDIDTLNVYINSGGGDVFAGWNIINILQRHKAQKIGYNDGLAASIAFDIIQSMDKVIAGENCMFMSHCCWTYACGNRHDLREQADMMEKIDNMLAATASKRSGKTIEQMNAIQDAESWYTAKEALDEGFADEINEAKKIDASIDGDFIIYDKQRFSLKRYKHTPKLANKEPPPKGGFFMLTDNGEEIQPVADITALFAQRSHFKTIKEKLLEV